MSSSLDKLWNMIDLCKAGLEMKDETARVVEGARTIRASGKRAVELYQLLRDLKRRSETEDDG